MQENNMDRMNSIEIVGVNLDKKKMSGLLKVKCKRCGRVDVNIKIRPMKLNLFKCSCGNCVAILLGKKAIETYGNSSLSLDAMELDYGTYRKLIKGYSDRINKDISKYEYVMARLNNIKNV